LIDSTRQLNTLAHLTGELEYLQVSFARKMVRRLRRLQASAVPPDTRREKIWRAHFAHRAPDAVVEFDGLKSERNFCGR